MTVTWQNKHKLPDFIESSGYTIIHKASGTHAYDSRMQQSAQIDATVQAMIDSYDGLAVFKAEKIAQAKALASEKILSIAPEWKQRNLIARSVELTRKGVVLSSSEQAESDAIGQVWGRVKAIRDSSDLIEQDISALQSESAVAAYDVVTSEKWSE